MTFTFDLEKEMALMMVLMVVLLLAVPGGHMGLLGSHHSSEQTSQSHEHDAAKPKPEQSPSSHEHDAAKPNQ